MSDSHIIQTINKNQWKSYQKLYPIIKKNIQELNQKISKK
jgi:hypothetical protein